MSPLFIGMILTPQTLIIGHVLGKTSALIQISGSIYNIFNPFESPIRLQKICQCYRKTCPITVVCKLHHGMRPLCQTLMLRTVRISHQQFLQPELATGVIYPIFLSGLVNSTWLHPLMLMLPTTMTFLAWPVRSCTVVGVFTPLVEDTLCLRSILRTSHFKSA
jgi:hypothetical protein